MIGRNRRTSLRLRLGIAAAAAVVVGGGAAGVVAVSASHSNTTTAQSAGYSSQSGRWMSYSSAMSSAMNGWSKSPNKSIVTLSQMKPMSAWYQAAWHHHTIALQRGVVVATGRNTIAVKSFNGHLELWNLSKGTKVVNVASNPTAQSAMSGGTMQMPAKMMKAKGLAKGDFVFIFGERVKGKLIAQLVLFAAPAKVTPTPPTPPTMKATPGATMVPTTPAPAPTTSAGLQFSGKNS